MEERKVIRKWIWVWDFEKEERWLNEMAQVGWVLDKIGYCRFEFKRCEPGEYVVRLEMHPENDGYVEFMQETGAEYIGNMLQWKYFRKKAGEGSFDIFSDIDSRIGHLNKIGKMLSGVGAANLVIGLANSINPIVHLGWINLLCAALLMYGLGRIHGKKKHWKKNGCCWNNKKKALPVGRALMFSEIVHEADAMHSEVCQAAFRFDLRQAP